MLMAVDRDIERLERMIEIATLKGEGDEPRTVRLREELAELKGAGYSTTDDEDELEELPDTKGLSAPDYPPLDAVFPQNIARTLQNHGLFSIDDMARIKRLALKTMLSPKDVRIASYRLAAVGASCVLGSSPDALDVPPPKTLLAIDVRQGILLEDLLSIGERVAKGELTQRAASRLMGSPEDKSWHQRFPSAFNRHSDLLSPFFVREITHDFKPQEWFSGASLLRIPEARLRIFGASVSIHCSPAEAYKAMKLAPLNEGKGRGGAHGSWRGCSVVFREAA